MLYLDSLDPKLEDTVNEELQHLKGSDNHLATRSVDSLCTFVFYILDEFAQVLRLNSPQYYFIITFLILELNIVSIEVLAELQSMAKGSPTHRNRILFVDLVRLGSILKFSF